MCRSATKTRKHEISSLRSSHFLRFRAFVLSWLNSVQSSLRDLGHANLRAELADDARAAARVDRPAHVLPPRHEVQVDVRPPPLARALVERLFRFVGRAGSHPAEP